MRDKRLQQWSQALRKLGFVGDIDLSLASRTVMATDNSVYEVVPQAVVYPRETRDIEHLLQLSHQQFPELTFTVRGGGTSTNGQSLGDGIMIDCSRYLRGIKHLDLNRQEVTVEPGVVLDELNRFLAPFGLFFPVSISTGSRATLGGMFNTNACGKGSTYYGRMSDNVRQVQAVLSDGTVFTTAPLTREALSQVCARDERVASLYRQVEQTVTQHAAEIQALYPGLVRTLTGYTLAEVWRGEWFDLSAVLAGSEGTLAVVTELTLAVRPLPQYKVLAVIQYTTFMQALDDGPLLSALRPVAIEAVDERILSMAQHDVLYPEVCAYISHPTQAVGGLTLVEWVVDTPAAGEALEQTLRQHLAEHAQVGRLQIQWVPDAQHRQQLWELRKKCVGLLGNFEWQGRRPVSGIEDTLVPVAQLKPFISALQHRLAARGLAYGMYGHLDAGCVHVRPAFNLQDAEEAAHYFALVRDVAALVAQYQGIMWGEHGKGFRSEFVPAVFGETLFAELCKIKTAFDPTNRLNPGKIAVPSGQTAADLLAIDQFPLQAELNRSISIAATARYAAALSCNGNGACFSQATREVMCPSYKVTGERIHSPKGRARLARQWLRQKHGHPAVGGGSVLTRWMRKLREPQDFSHAVFQAMAGCLGCRGCQTQCPAHVNVPSFKANFLASYYSRYARSFAAFLLARSENVAYRYSGAPRVANSLLHNPLSQGLLQLLGLVNLPRFSTPSLRQQLSGQQLASHSVMQLTGLVQEGDIVVLQDFVTSSYDAELVVQTLMFLQRLGLRAWLLEPFINGKAWHAQGELENFHVAIKHNLKAFEVLANRGVRFVGIDPSITLTYRHEYREAFPHLTLPPIHLLQELLTPALLTQQRFRPVQQSITLLQHCTERATCSQGAGAWQALFAAAGYQLTIAEVGCCGMAGSYGMQREYTEYAKQLFAMSWETVVQAPGSLLATGFSCRSQVHRLTKRKAEHPLVFLANQLV